MERTRISKKADLILTSDWHLREDTPTCFTGDWYSEQWEAVQFIFDLQAKHQCPVIHAGDLFHHWKPSPWLLSKTMFFLPKEFRTIYGQHDLPQHNWELREKSGLHTLEKAGRLKVMDGYHYGQPIYTGASAHPIPPLTTKILVWHHLTYTVKPFPDASGGMAEGILRKYPQFDLIVTGDNHQSFTAQYKNRLLVNPGNITRQTADQADFKPRVYLWYADTNTVTPVYLPISEGTISREHIQAKEERDERISAFISQLEGDWDVGLSFEQNLEAFKQKNDISDSVMEIIYKALENGND